MKLILARHGETNYNHLRKFYGSTDVSLDEKGKKQAQDLAEKVRKLHPTLFVRTNLRRTKQTISAIEAFFPTTPTMIIPDLAEKGFGNWEGLDADEIEAKYPEDWQKWLAAPLTYTPATVEPFDHFQTRVHQGLRWLLEHVTESDVVFIVAHLGSLRLIYQELVDSTADFYSLDFKASCYSILELKNGEVSRQQLNL
ncbi:histidine phosphatase family protein [Limosilactobacillus sp. RRLNB_1_1]|uniref:Histidine phosphatase family protein n=1 Tax=Limosilactobacillus albertensis TaxID=2759752 RepID=A0A7W3Y8H6_9LACO|nr:histidine phosphatase family protein [Limosilactobacillus albertensis]MBB1069492.1 histidine phosphatase family protein [Limosilactobacillus albertensis]MCD7118018.1 histidine phosphatase family protein [Limosilactobacillus albertensis]MCD7127728.1 histidine phosphatase family protein [Limosilactobacillus albertensis]